MKWHIFAKALARKCNTINELCLGVNATRIVPPSFLTSLINLKKLVIFDENDELVKIYNYGEGNKVFIYYKSTSTTSILAIPKS